MPSAYINQLKRESEERSVQRIAPPTLAQKFVEWFEGVPEISRLRPYAMTEMERALETQGRYLSPILFSLGWERRRKWSSKTQYLRYWVPPGA